MLFWGQKEKAVEEEPELDPDVAAMMGFGGFRSSKKWSCFGGKWGASLDLPK